jgi:hypothetical protein
MALPAVEASATGAAEPASPEAIAAGDAANSAAKTAAVMTGKFLFRMGMSPCIHETEFRGGTIG